MFGRSISLVVLAACLIGVGLSGCRPAGIKQPGGAASALREIPSVRLAFRYEPDVPAPADPNPQASGDALYPPVRADFDGNRSADLLARTIVSPNSKRVLVAYRRTGDAENTFRLDMYADDGKFIRRVSPDSMAVDFLDSIVWSPDSSTVAFVAITRTGGGGSLTTPVANTNSNANTTPGEGNSNTTVAETPEPEVSGTPEPPAPPNVLTFRTEQIYLCSSDGTDVKPITQTENLIYYYFVWSPDGSMLASLASRLDEWRYLMAVSAQNGEKFVPAGRPRIIEKNGRERTLDDAWTKVKPVWSPDSSKVAVAFDKPIQIRVYDAVGTAPTQAAIPLRNPLLISSQAYDRAKQSQTDPNSNVAPVIDANANVDVTALPDEKTLVSFQPIVLLNWATEDNIYFQTGYVREFENSSEDLFSSLRWHRLILSGQGK